MYGDIQKFWEKLDETIALYEFKMGRKPDVHSCAQMVSNTLYGKRFFPTYAFNIVCGIDKNGKGAAFVYDAIGSCGSESYGCQGSGKELLFPVMDNIFEGYNHVEKNHPKDAETISKILLDAFQSVAERDIYTGDGCEIRVLRLNKEPEVNLYPIRRD